MRKKIDLSEIYKAEVAQTTPFPEFGGSAEESPADKVEEEFAFVQIYLRSHKDPLEIVTDCSPFTVSVLWGLDGKGRNGEFMLMNVLDGGFVSAKKKEIVAISAQLVPEDARADILKEREIIRERTKRNKTILAALAPDPID